MESKIFEIFRIFILRKTSKVCPKFSKKMNFGLPVFCYLVPRVVVSSNKQMTRSEQRRMAVSCILIFLAIILAQFPDNHGYSVSSDLPYDQPAGQWNGKLQMDTAFINFTASPKNMKFNVSGISENCYLCDYQALRVNAKGDTYILVDTTFTFKIKITSQGQTCLINRSFVEYGQYEIKIGLLDKFTCRLDIHDESPADKPYHPIFVALGILAGAALFWYCLTLIWRKYHLGARIGIFTDNESLINADLGSPSHMSNRTMSQSDDSDQQLKQKPKPAKQKRIKSLDTFRGIALTIMIFVNFGGGGYYFFHHSRWNGLTVADLVFPWFMWIMGVSITLSFQSLRRRQTSTVQIIYKIVRRTAILFLLGVFTSNLGNLEIYRVPGVLQRFAACYFVVALVQVVCSPTEDTQPKGVWWDSIRDIVSLWSQWCIMLIVLITYIIVTYAVKVDNCPTGYTGPGGIGRDYPEAYNCTGGVAAKIDHKIFRTHVYHGGTYKKLYRVTVFHDPEGALGTLTSIFLVFLGVQAGNILYTYPSHRARLFRWFIWSILLGCLAIGLSGGTKNEGVIPINKNLWSVSFIFATGAMAFFLLCACYLLIDVYDVWNGSPFIFPGMNSIVVYCGHELLGEHFPFSWNLDPYHTHAEELLMNIVGTGSWLLIAFYMYYIDFFVKI